MNIIFNSVIGIKMIMYIQLQRRATPLSLILLLSRDTAATDNRRRVNNRRPVESYNISSHLLDHKNNLRTD